MEEIDTEIKIIFKKVQSLSSYFVKSLAKVLQSRVAVAHKQTKQEPMDIFNIEIRYPGWIEIYGELVAANIIWANAKNGPIKFIGDSLFKDHWIAFITGDFKILAEAVIFSNDKSAKDK